MDKMILLDIETQTFSVHSGIFEVACLVIEDYEIVDKLYLGKEIKGYRGNRAYGFGFHDISESKKYISSFKGLIEKYPYPIVAHNCPFDRKFLVFYEWIDEEYPIYCSMKAIRYADGSVSSYSLVNLVKHFRIAEDVEHNAMSDVMNTYELLTLIKPQTWLPVGVHRAAKQRKSRSVDDIDLDIETTAILSGETLCFTGKSDYPRYTMQEIAIKNGAMISNNITSKTTLLVVGLDAGSKHTKAEENGIPIISDVEFMEMIHLSDVNIKITRSTGNS